MHQELSITQLADFAPDSLSISAWLWKNSCLLHALCIGREAAEFTKVHFTCLAKLIPAGWTLLDAIFVPNWPAECK